MTNIATVFKAEITRLARREVRENSDGLRKIVAAQRTEIANLKRRLQELEGVVKKLANVNAGQEPPLFDGEDANLVFDCPRRGGSRHFVLGS